ncbi:hypothetical protein JCM19240_735 [Vibrio maritimus]|uniref:Undecaprenyldiphospho-muramoylpentapeptide beta-N-acetylglucosaminyltransferase n=1 Tax=Vibrio maritimus TaxID=990268 RepID=A0A090TE57_9VIBR|nr:hypothetical protein JCM19240_735 [Vibrio maritimus]
MRSSNAIEVVQDEHELAQKVESLLQSPDALAALANSAQQVVKQSQGAIDRTLKSVSD